MASVFGVDRSIWEHPAFDQEAFTQVQAWLWLVSSAAYQQKRIRSPRGPVVLERGEFSFSTRFLAEKWLWSKSRVDRFIDTLCKRDMLRDSKRDNAKVYSILNYNKFQIVKAPKRDNERDSLREESGTAAGQQRDKEKDSRKTVKTEKIDLTTFGLALSSACAAAAQEIIRLPTNRFETAGEEVSVSKTTAEDYARTYPAVDVPQELRAMRRWLIDNGSKRKTVRGMAKFINGWLEREQNRGGNQARAGPSFPRETVKIISLLDEQPNVPPSRPN